MATYNLREVMPDKISVGDVLNLPYRIGEPDAYGKSTSYGGSKTVLLPKGEYLLECWGSASALKGKNYIVNWDNVGTGGYAKGVLSLNTNTNVILTAGGVASNGGVWVGSHGSDYIMRGSGGGSDIRLINNNEYHRVIVAGGGGQLGYVNELTRIIYNPDDPRATPEGFIYFYTTTALPGGWGGGISGGDGTASPESMSGTGGKSNAGGRTVPNASYSSYATNGSFLNGGNNDDGWTSYEGAGGGGWYGGGGGGRKYTGTFGEVGYKAIQGAGGGGSGFVWKSGVSVPSGYALGSQYYLKNTVCVSGHEANAPILEPDGVTYNVGHKDEGYCRITVLSMFNGIYIGGDNGKARSVKGMYIGDANGKARRVIKGYIGDSNGKAKRFL